MGQRSIGEKNKKKQKSIVKTENKYYMYEGKETRFRCIMLGGHIKRFLNVGDFKKYLGKLW